MPPIDPSIQMGLTHGGAPCRDFQSVSAVKTQGVLSGGCAGQILQDLLVQVAVHTTLAVGIQKK